jgi:hypothetical protein
MNTDRFKHKETTSIEAGLLLNFGKNQNSKDLYMILEDKLSAVISVDLWLSYLNNKKEEAG